MSLETALKENTEAIHALIARLAVMPVIPADAEVVEKPAAKKTVKSPEVVSSPPTAAEPEAAAPVQTESPSENTENATATTAPTLTYDDIKGPFLALVNAKGRDAAVEVLDALGVVKGGKLTDVPAEKWAEALALIEQKAGE